MTLIDQAFDTYKRESFVLPGDRAVAQEDIALPIGHNQTISQPSTVRKMLEWLDPMPGEKILDVGSGSGWTTALLSHIVGSSGVVYAVERIPELVKMGEQNCQRLNIHNALFFPTANTIGLPQFAPYDRILVSAAATEMKDELGSQLKIGGKLVIPINLTIFEMTKTVTGWSEQQHPGFLFVPFIDR
jgi:protein-L-isoaspartate(D-aspartate) O-methyltransferase